MKLDGTLVKVIREVAVEIQELHGVTLTQDQILDILDNKSKAIRNAFYLKRDVRDIYLGSFVIKDSRELFYTEKKAALEAGATKEEAKQIALKKLDTTIKKVIGLQFKKKNGDNTQS